MPCPIGDYCVLAGPALLAGAGLPTGPGLVTSGHREAIAFDIESGQALDTSGTCAHVRGWVDWRAALGALLRPSWRCECLSMRVLLLLLCVCVACYVCVCVCACPGKGKGAVPLLTRLTNDPFKVLKTKEGVAVVYAIALHLAALYMYTHPCPPGPGL